MKALIKIILLSGVGAVLILDSPTAGAAAAESVQLCLRTVIPSILPIMVLSMLMSASMNAFRFRALDPIARLCRLPSGTGSFLALGILGGYPAGAQCISHAYERGQLSKDAARRMIILCNNCGPAFLFGMMARSFSNSAMAWKIWLVCICGSILTALILPGGGGTFKQSSPGYSESPVELMDRALRAMAQICGWIIVFRVVLTFVDRWFLWRMPGWLRVTLCGLTELTNGCVALGQIPHDGLRFVLSCGMLSFGGLCVTMQTLSVIHPSLDRRMYFPGKVLHGCISAILACILYRVGWHIPLIAGTIGVIAVVFLGKIVKNSRFPEKVGV